MWTRKGLSVHHCSGQRQTLSALIKLKFAPAWTGFLLSIQMWTYDKSFACLGLICCFVSWCVVNLRMFHVKHSQKKLTGMIRLHFKSKLLKSAA